MAADTTRLRRIADQVMTTWTAQDVEQVLDCYRDDLVYLDPNTRGPVHGRDAMRAYLTKLFGRWTMSWRAEELFALEGADGAAVRWTATIAPSESAQSIEVSGIDLVILDGDLIARNEVYFDRSPLIALLASPAAA